MLHGWKLRKIRIREQEKLDEYSFEKFKKITEYIKISNLKYFEKEEALQQIMDMMLQLKHENKSLDPIFDDYEDFCKAIIKEYTSDKSTLYTVLHYIQRIIIIMLMTIISFIIFLRVFYPKVNIVLNIHSLLTGFFVATFYFVFTHKNIKEKIISGICLLLLLLADGNIQQTKFGRIIEGALVTNTNLVLVALILIGITIEIYKRIYDKLKLK